METKNMQFKDVLVFKSEYRIDWRKTRAKIAQWFRDNYPDMNPTSRLYNVYNASVDVEKVIKKQGTYNTYKELVLKTNYKIQIGD